MCLWRNTSISTETAVDSVPHPSAVFDETCITSVTKARRQCAGDAKAMIDLPQKQRAAVATQMSAGKIHHHFA